MIEISRPETLGELLRVRRYAAGDTRSELADAIGYTPTMISHYEAGRRGHGVFAALATWNRLLRRYGLRLAIVVEETRNV